MHFEILHFEIYTFFGVFYMTEFFGTKKGILFLNALKYAFFFACLYLFSVGGIRGEIFPFAFGFFVALVWCEQNIFAVGTLFVGASLLANFSVESLVSSAFCVVFFVIVIFTHKSLHQRISPLLLAFYFVFSQALFLYCNLVSVSKILPCIVHLVVGEIFMFACIKIFKTLLVKGVGLKLNIDESVSLGLFLVALGSGLSASSFLGYLPLNAVATFLILLSTYVYASSSVPIAVGLSLGLGNAIFSGSVIFVGVFGVFAFASVCFKSTSKYFSTMAIIICDVILGLYFNVYGEYSYRVLISTILGEVLFVIISNNTLALLKAIFGQTSSTVALRNMVNKSRDNLCKKMYSLSAVFDEMDRSFKNTIKGLLPASQAKNMLMEELLSKVCYDCPEKHRCHRVMERETRETLDQILSAGLDKGKITLLDIPPHLSSRCAKSNIILSTVNGLLASYKQYTYCVSSVDTSKALIAEEFKGVSRLLLKLADRAKQLVTFDEEFEQKITEELAFENINILEAYVFESEGKKVSITLTIKNMDLENPKLLACLTKNMGRKMALASSEIAEIPGYAIATFVEAPKFECIFGTSGTAKFGNEVSGDSYSFLRLSENKLLLAVCDGMGSGEDAQKMSDTTISIIENFYKADFDDETILSSTNKLLAMQMTDNYSALDICVLDLSNALADFIKVGAPIGLVKHTESTEVLSGTGALPIGILKEIKPSIEKKILTNCDIIILASDGVVDAFMDETKFKNFVNSIASTNPQEVADMIVAEAINQNQGEARDDMTCLCARIYLNV